MVAKRLLVATDAALLEGSGLKQRGRACADDEAGLDSGRRGRVEKQTGRVCRSGRAAAQAGLEYPRQICGPQ